MRAGICAVLFLGGICEAADTASWRWVGLSDPRLEVNGLHWLKENRGELVRLPLRAKDLVAPAVWQESTCPSGGRIRFRTDTRVLAIRLEYPSAPDMLNIHAMGQTGVDLYADGVYRGTAFARKDAGPGKVYEHTFFRFEQQPRREREIVLYLPIYKPVKVLGIGLDPEAAVWPAHSFAAAKPVVFYGTSITQGGCASRPGLSYPSLLGRMLDIDFIDLGFSGSGLGPGEEARLLSEIDAACYVLDFGINNGTLEALQKAYPEFLRILRAARPATPILVVTPIYESREFWPGGESPPWANMRAYLRTLVQQLAHAGDGRIEVVEGTDLLGPSEGDGLTDGTHPNDYGFRLIAERLVPRLRRLLGK